MKVCPECFERAADMNNAGEWLMLHKAWDKVLVGVSSSKSKLWSNRVLRSKQRLASDPQLSPAAVEFFRITGQARVN